MRRPNPPYPLWFAYLFAILPLITFWASGLFDLDEGFYGAVVAEMNRRGDYITPYYNGHPWFEKPILLYWLAAPFMKIFGVWIGPRIPSVLCTIALYVLCGKFAKRHMGEWQARHVVYCLGTSLLILALGRLMMTDAALNLALTGAFLSFWDHLNPAPANEPKPRTSHLLTGFFLGVGVLAKGPVALLLFAPIAALTYYQNPDLRPKFFKGFLPALIVLLATISTWYVPCYLANGQDFVQKFLIDQNLKRFTGGDAAHSLGLKGLPFYIPILLIAVIPWGFTEAKRIWQSKTATPLNRYLFTWAATIFLFFTISSAKLPHYILPVIAPLALLAANTIAQKEKTSARNLQVVMGVSILLLFIISGLQTSLYVQSGQAEAHTMALRHPEIDTVFRLSRQQQDLGTGTTNLQQTSLPSLIMVLNKPVSEIDDPNLVKTESVVFTRVGRVKPEWGWLLQEKGKNFEVWIKKPNP
jgi:4-amino-4-deoxy-L-arabinose transferase-like glycosyltransferase